MPGTVIGTKLNYGYPGQISRHGDEVSRTFPVKEGEILFGEAVALNDDGTVQAFGATHDAAKFCGVAMRRVKTATVWPNQNRGEYKAHEACDVLERGSVIVECLKGSPKVGGDVYVYKQGKKGFAAEEDAGNTVKLEGVRWASDKDARNMAEIVLTTRHGV